MMDESNHKYVITIYLAFGNLWWSSLFVSLRIGCLANLYQILKNYVGRTVTYRTLAGKVNQHITKGCLQGSICGPTFWDIILDDLLYKLDNHNEILAVTYTLHNYANYRRRY